MVGDQLKKKRPIIKADKLEYSTEIYGQGLLRNPASQLLHKPNLTGSHRFSYLEVFSRI